MKVLITDDDADSRELVRLTLSMHGIQAVEADGGARCLELARDVRPDAILLDVMMPFMDGPTTLAALRAAARVRRRRTARAWARCARSSYAARRRGSRWRPAC